MFYQIATAKEIEEFLGELGRKDLEKNPPNIQIFTNSGGVVKEIILTTKGREYERPT